MEDGGVGAQDLRCKCKSQEAILQALELSVTTGASCEAAVAAAFDLATATAYPAALQRYNALIPSHLAPLPDLATSSGVGWLGTPLYGGYENGSFALGAVSLHTSLTAPFGLAGMYYCEVPSPARALEYIYIDSMLGFF
jgi:hypothetical protein